MTKILYMDVNVFEADVLFEKGMSLVSAKRREKIKKFKNPMTARLSLGAGVLLKLALEESGLGDKMDQIETGAHGKPYLKQTDFHFSLSHSGHYTICAFSSAPIGADLQQIKETLPQRTTRILSDSEKEYLDQLPETERSQLFYRLWARKESLIKWDGRGLQLPMEQLSFVQDGILMDTMTFEGKQLYFREYQDLLPQYAICLCDEIGIFSEKIVEITAKNLKNP